MPAKPIIRTCKYTPNLFINKIKNGCFCIKYRHIAINNVNIMIPIIFFNIYLLYTGAISFSLFEIKNKIIRREIDVDVIGPYASKK